MQTLLLDRILGGELREARRNGHVLRLFSRTGRCSGGVHRRGRNWKRKDIDVVSLKSFDADVKLGTMLAFATNTPWTVDAVRSTPVWPPEPTPKTPEDFDRLPEDSPWFLSDYFLEGFAQEFRDALASISEAQFQRMEKEWTPTEEFEADRYDANDALSCFRSLVDLAKRAKAANDGFFFDQSRWLGPAMSRPGQHRPPG